MKSLLIGITGNSGCGQTSAARFALESGIDGFCSLDEIGHRLLTRQYVRTELSMALYQPDLKNIPAESLREYLGEIAFRDRNILEGINSVLHPRMKRWASISAETLRASGGIFILEGALLCELGMNRILDILIVVRDTKQRASARVAHRDSISKDMVADRWNYQWPLSAKVELSDFVIDNDGDLHSLKDKTFVIFGGIISHEH